MLALLITQGENYPPPTQGNLWPVLIGLVVTFGAFILWQQRNSRPK